MVKVTIDGKELSVPPGTNVIEAAKLAGIEIPHYCYHKKLSIAGNCRMCLVDVGMPKLDKDRKPEVGADGKPVIQFGPKLAIGCNQSVAEGMVVETRSPKVIKAREGVMEFLLINHPLDCPICDQAGECRLQEFAVDYGKGASRFVEEKEHKPKRVRLSDKIMLDDERCILCSRCIRFMKEVAKQDCLGFIQRGSRSVLTCYPGQEPNTNYDLNIVDICPVGALTSNDFRFRQRVWFLKETRSVCPNCATGCNILVGSRENVVHRLTPRDNPDVNQSWMCDYGRLNYKFVNDPRRLTQPLVNGQPAEWVEAQREAKERLAVLKGWVAGIASARGTTEELFLFDQWLRGELGATLLDVVPRAGAADHFLLNPDRNPNLRGAQLTGVAAAPPGSAIPKISEAIRLGSVRALVVMGEDVVLHGIPADVLARLECLLVIDSHPGETSGRAHVVLPGAVFAEKRGTFINAQGRIQRLNAAVQCPGLARPEWQVLSSLMMSVAASADEAFARMAQQIPALAGLSLAAIGDQGLAVAG